MVQEIRTSLSDLRQNFEMLNTSFDGMKIGLTEMENKIKEIESAAAINNVSPAGPSSEFKIQNILNNVDILLLVEIWISCCWCSNSWIELKPMEMSRSSASSVLYNGSVLVTGGSSHGRVMTSMEQWSFNMSPFILPCWSNLAVKFPRPLRGHRTVLYKGRLIVFGGGDGNDDSDMIYEAKLQFPSNTKILANLLPDSWEAVVVFW